MKTCPNCGQENPNSSRVCTACFEPLKKKRRTNRVLSGIGWIVGGLILIAAEFFYDLSLFNILTIPWGMAILGGIGVIKGIVDVVRGIADMLGRKDQ